MSGAYGKEELPDFLKVFKNVEKVSTMQVMDKEGKWICHTVYRTTDYSPFTFHPANRWATLKDKEVQELIEDIQVNDRLYMFPITCHDDLVIYDGQHRYLAGGYLKRYLYFYIDNNFQLTDSIQVGSSTDKWSYEQILHTYSSLNNPHYVAMKRLCKKYPHITLVTFIELAYRLPTGSMKYEQVRKDFRKGKYTPNDLSFAELVAKRVGDFRGLFDDYSTRPFVWAIKNLSSNPDYDHEYMVKKVTENRKMLFHCRKTEQYIDVLNEVYNFNRRQRNRVDLKYIRSNNPNFRKNIEKNYEEIEEDKDE